MQRRSFLGVALTSVVVVSGCLGSSSGDREATIETWWDAWESGDVDRYIDVHHEESTLYAELEESREMLEETLGPDEGVEWEIESREPIEESEDEVVIEEEYYWEDPDGEAWIITDHITLRTNDDGEWRIWDIENEETEEAE